MPKPMIAPPPMMGGKKPARAVAKSAPVANPMTKGAPPMVAAGQPGMPFKKGGKVGSKAKAKKGC